jgi:flagellar biosynthesis component FlhA
MEDNKKGLTNLIIGTLLVIVGIAWYFVRIPYLSTYVHLIDFYPFYEILVLFIVGIFGVCIFFVGLVLAWMGWDDYKMGREMEDTEESEEEYEEEKVEYEEKEEFEEEESPTSKEEELEAELRKEMETTSEIVCEVCGKVVKSKAGLSAHMRTHK